MSNLPDNVTVRDLDPPKPFVCSGCGTVEYLVMCGDCDEYLCERCSKDHQCQ